MLAGVRYANCQMVASSGIASSMTNLHPWHLALTLKKLSNPNSCTGHNIKTHLEKTMKNICQGTLSCISMSCLQELRWTATAGTGLCPMPCWHVFKKELAPTNKNQEQNIHSTPPCPWNIYTDCVLNIFIFFRILFTCWNSVEILKNAGPQPKRPPKLQVSRHPRPAMWNETKKYPFNRIPCQRFPRLMTYETYPMLGKVGVATQAAGEIMIFFTELER